MSTEYGAASYNVVPQDAVDATCAHYSCFLQSVAESRKKGESIDDALKRFAVNLEQGHRLSYRAKMNYKYLQNEFKKKWGLILKIAYVGEGVRGGSLSDQVFWHVEDARIYNPAYLKFCKEAKTEPTTDWFLTCDG
jgi:hypothetical protein